MRRGASANPSVTATLPATDARQLLIRPQRA
jgi:hypothetical protein